MTGRCGPATLDGVGGHPLDAKGVGEAATVGAPPAIVNAVVDAPAHFGVRHVEIPMTPNVVGFRAMPHV